jgi:hypothetical protein
MNVSLVEAVLTLGRWLFAGFSQHPLDGQQRLLSLMYNTPHSIRVQ